MQVNLRNFEHFCVVDAGVDPKKFWTLTLRQVLLLIQRSRNKVYSQWELNRQIEFAIYNTTFAGMSGERPFKNIKKPKDLYRLPTDQTKVVGVDNEMAKVNVERMKQHFKWQKDSTKNN